MSAEKVNNPQWRERIAVIGKENFEIEEMIRLGFLENTAAAEKLTKEVSALAEARKKLIQIDKEIDELGDVEVQIGLIRQARIERVKLEESLRIRAKLSFLQLNDAKISFVEFMNPPSLAEVSQAESSLTGEIPNNLPSGGFLRSQLLWTSLPG